MFDVTASDNCAGSLTLMQVGGLPSGSTFPSGTTTVEFTATDGSGNQTNCSFDVTVPAVIAANPAVTNVTCFGENDGSIATSTTGGTPPYAYSWSNGGTGANNNGLTAGQYTVSITDAAGCQLVQNLTVSEPAQLSTTLIAIVNSTFNQSNGSIDVTVAGGVMPYAFVWKNLSGTTIGTLEDISGLPPGSYTLSVTDANGCMSLSTYTIQNTSATSESGLFRELVLFPNPSTGQVTMEVRGLASPVALQVDAYDITGRPVLHQAATGTRLPLDFSGKADGVYLLKIVVGTEILTERLVISK
jgi:hypothetical protein